MTIDCPQLAPGAAKACRPWRNQEFMARVRTPRSHVQRFSHAYVAQLCYHDNRPSPKGRESMATGASLALLGFRIRKEHRKRRDHDNPPFLKDSVAHGEGADDPDPDLADLLR